MKNQGGVSTLESRIYNFNFHETQMEQSSEVATGAEQMNILNIRNKSMIIVQLKKKLMFKEVYSNLNDFNEAYLFYERNKKLMKNDILEAGNHFIFYYSKLIGGSGKPPESD
jgi:hypothetical protein